MSRAPDASSQLERALVQMAAVAGIDAAIGAADWRRWASATFTGARHRITLKTAPSASLVPWLTSLPEAEFRLRNHLVADLVILGRHDKGETVEIEIEALTVEDG